MTNIERWLTPEQAKILESISLTDNELDFLESLARRAERMDECKEVIDEKIAEYKQIDHPHYEDKYIKPLQELRLRVTAELDGLPRGG